MSSENHIIIIIIKHLRILEKMNHVVYNLYQMNENCLG